MSQPYIGQITLFAGNFAPRGYAFCNGQLLAISQNEALFSLIGTTYGGNGTTNFQLPDLQSRIPVHMGQGPGLSPYMLGQNAGSQRVTLTDNTMPGHMHMLLASTGAGTATTIDGTVIPATPTTGNAPLFYAAQGSGQPALNFYPLSPSAVSYTGGSQPHNNLMPSLCISFVIALTGIFPPRN